MATYRTRTGISVTPGVYTEFGKDVKRPNWRIGNPVVNPRAVDSIKKAYEKLGLDYEMATGDPEYVDKAFEQVRNRLKAAGVELGEDASIHDLARAYDKLDDNQRRRYASYSDNSSTATPANAVTETAAAPVVQGGKPKAEPEATPAIPPRRGAAAPEVTTVGRGNIVPGETNVSLGGRPVAIDNTSAVNALKGQQASTARTAEIQAKREERAVRNDASSDERRLAQERMATEIALDNNLDALLAARQKRIDANRARRADSRYKSRKLSNEDDWKNLAREGSNYRNYAATSDETADQKAEREAAVSARNGRIKALQDRMSQMADKTLLKEGETYAWKDGKPVVTTKDGKVVPAEEVAKRTSTGVGDDGMKYGNSFYANDPNRQKDLANLKKIVDKSIADGTITDAQLEAATKKLDSWQGGADARAERRAEAQKMRDAEQVRGLRQKYGMTDAAAFSDSDVREYHEGQQKASRAKILGEMRVTPGATSGGAGNNVDAAEGMQNFSDNWQKLLDNGFDPAKTFQNSMQDAKNKEAYKEGLSSIAQDDPDRADKIDQLRRRFIMNQAMQENGLTDASTDGAPGKQVVAEPGQTLGQAMSADLPGKAVLANGRDGNAVLDTADRGAAKAEAAAAVPQASLDVLSPRQPPQARSESGVLKARDKARRTQQDWGGGQVADLRRYYQKAEARPEPGDQLSRVQGPSPLGREGDRVGHVPSGGRVWENSAPTGSGTGLDRFTSVDPMAGRGRFAPADSVFGDKRVGPVDPTVNRFAPVGPGFGRGSSAPVDPWFGRDRSAPVDPWFGRDRSAPVDPWFGRDRSAPVDPMRRGRYRRGL